MINKMNTITAKQKLQSIVRPGGTKPCKAWIFAVSSSRPSAVSEESLWFPCLNAVPKGSVSTGLNDASKLSIAVLLDRRKEEQSCEVFNKYERFEQII